MTILTYSFTNLGDSMEGTLVALGGGKCGDSGACDITRTHARTINVSVVSVRATAGLYHCYAHVGWVWSIRFPLLLHQTQSIAVIVGVCSYVLVRVDVCRCVRCSRQDHSLRAKTA